MKQIIFTTILILVFSFSVFAQNENSLCPTINVSGGGVTAPDEPLTFSAFVSDSAKYPNLEYLWTVSNGTIIEGQGTATIKTEIPESDGRNITATVQIKGIPENCANTASETSSPNECRLPILNDEFGRLPNVEVKARMAEVYVKLGDEPNSQGYIINYGTDREIAAREKQIQRAIASRKFDASRVTIVKGGLNPNGEGVLTKIYIVPPGANNPEP